MDKTKTPGWPLCIGETEVVAGPTTRGLDVVMENPSLPIYLYIRPAGPIFILFTRALSFSVSTSTSYPIIIMSRMSSAPVRLH